MAVSNAIHVYRTQGAWSETYFRSRIRPALTVALLPAAPFEREAIYISRTQSSDNWARPWHVYNEERSPMAVYAATSLWTVAVSQLGIGALAVGVGLASGSLLLGVVVVAIATTLFVVTLVQPITQTLGFAFACALAFAAIAILTRQRTSNIAVGAFFGFGLLTGQETVPVLIAAGAVSLMIRWRREGLRGTAVAAAQWGAVALAIIAVYFHLVLGSSLNELYRFVTEDISFTQQLMKYTPNTLRGSLAAAYSVGGVWIAVAPAAVAALFALRPRDPLVPFLALWFALAFLMPLSMPFAFPRFFTGMIPPAVFAVVWAVFEMLSNAKNMKKIQSVPQFGLRDLTAGGRGQMRGGRALLLVCGFVLVLVDVLGFIRFGAAPPVLAVSLEPDAIRENPPGPVFVVALAALERLAPFGFSIPSDSGGSPQASELAVLEDDLRLGPAHLPGTEIRAKARGRYSHWGSSLYFTSSDGTDPRTNGRVYRVETPARPFWAITAAFAVANIVLLLLIAQWLPRLAFCSALAGCLAALLIAVLLRLELSSCLGLPYWFPDSNGYVAPALNPSLLPLSQMRTLGVPALVKLAFLVTPDPQSVLILHHLLWLLAATSVLAVLLLRYRLGLLAFVFAIYLSFGLKGLSYEYSMLSEHATRCLNLIFCAAILGCWGKAPRVRFGLLFGLITLAAILIRPNVAPLVLLSGLTLFSARGAIVKRRTWAAGAVFAGVLGLGMVGNVLAYHERFGTWRINEYDGWVLFCGFGHLLAEHSSTEPALTEALQPVVTRYREEYAFRGEYLCNWLVFGSTNETIREKLGETSPAILIRDHVQGRGPSGAQEFSELNRVMRLLALEGIASHPGEYAASVWHYFSLLFAHGPGGGHSLLSPSSAEGWLRSDQEWDRVLGDRRNLGSLEGRTSRSSACFVDLTRSSDMGWGVEPERIGLAIARWISVSTSDLGWIWFGPIALLGLVSLGLRRLPPATLVIFLPAVIVIIFVGWAALLGASDVSRFFFPVQDIYVLAWLAIPFGVWALGVSRR